MVRANIDWFVTNPTPPNQNLIDLLDDIDPPWWSVSRTARLISQLSPKHLAAVHAPKRQVSA
ncbi:hypothetical protein PsB1_0764 [Candidatus Phycosocius spiralis]|uniref:Uncharacterized protein n=1 Tax=Candidatus Phycosocius spiralis TaxID=2815099 RepID=A0ABQ4PUD9_9PROT|nr:hypothetical protein PsB1_0764 [Candidatus Phycosocius spiralis]